MVYFHTKYQHGYILEGQGMENIGISYSHLKKIIIVWYVIGGKLGIFSQFWYIVPRKISQT
jgi:hypothetical protein